MRDHQRTIIADLHVSPRIDPADQISRRVGFLKAYLRHCGAAGFVLGISGGQDSCLAGRLCQLAVEGLRDEGVPATVIALRLPYTVQADEDDAQPGLQFLRPDPAV